MEQGDRYFWGLGLEIFFTGVLKATASNVWLFLRYPSPLLPFSSPCCECCGKAGSRHSYLMNILCNLVLSFLYRDFLSLQSGCVPSETQSSHSSPSAIPLNQRRWPKQNQKTWASSSTRKSVCNQQQKSPQRQGSSYLLEAEERRALTTKRRRHEKISQ